MRLIDEATGTVYRTLEQGEVLTYRGRFEDCFEAKHSLVKTGEKREGWQLDSPLETLAKAMPPQGVKSRVALKLEEEYEDKLRLYARAEVDADALAKAKEDKNSFVNAIPKEVTDMLARKREMELARMVEERIAQLEKVVVALGGGVEFLKHRNRFF